MQFFPFLPGSPARRPALLTFFRMVFIFVNCWTVFPLAGQSARNEHSHIPGGLRVDLLRHPERVYKMGAATSQYLWQVTRDKQDSLQFEAVTSRQPAFSWTLSEDIKKQLAYQIVLVKTGPDKDSAHLPLKEKMTVIWNSGKVKKHSNIEQVYSGPVLLPGTVYKWKVRVWSGDAGADGRRMTAGRFSNWQYFKTADTLTNTGLPTFVLIKQRQLAVDSFRLGKDYLLYDFGRDGFGQPVLRLQSEIDDSLTVLLGEKLLQKTISKIDAHPPGTVRFRTIKIAVKKGVHNYPILITSDARNTKVNAMKMPPYIGEVLPFRYLAIQGNLAEITPVKISRNLIHVPFDSAGTVFNSSDSILNKIWDLCKYTIKATSFTGYYVDGDRERIPYEADALINQLSHYSTDADFNMAKRTLTYLIYHPTWPTEWSLQNLLIAYYDYMYSGDDRTVARLYKQLQAKVLTALQDSTGLISTRTGRQSVDFLKSIHYKVFDGNEGLKDIVDWPHTPEETDSFVFTDYNAVVNAFYYKALSSMAVLAAALDKPDDASVYTRQALAVKSAFIRHFSDPVTGLIKDGAGTAHCSLHANMFALAFGLVPDKHRQAVLEFIKSRGLSCSVYGAQFLLEALGRADHTDDAIALIRSTEDRSWFNMLREGATMTMEAWGQRFKPNQDWNHAWGTAPAGYIVRFLMGIRPLKPGFEKVLIEPHPFGLHEATISYKTIRGNIDLSFRSDKDRFTLQLTLPGNTTATVRLPVQRPENPIVLMDGRPVQGIFQQGYYQIDDVASGTHQFIIK